MTGTESLIPDPPDAPINLFGRLQNLADAILFLHTYCSDNLLGDGTKGTYVLEDFALKHWDGLDLNEIERAICEAVESIDLLSGRETERVIDYTLGRIGEPDG